MALHPRPRNNPKNYKIQTNIIKTILKLKLNQHRRKLNKPIKKLESSNTTMLIKILPCRKVRRIQITQIQINKKILTIKKTKKIVIEIYLINFKQLLKRYRVQKKLCIHKLKVQTSY